GPRRCDRLPGVAEGEEVALPHRTRPGRASAWPGLFLFQRALLNCSCPAIPPTPTVGAPAPTVVAAMSRKNTVRTSAVRTVSLVGGTRSLPCGQPRTSG